MFKLVAKIFCSIAHHARVSYVIIWVWSNKIIFRSVSS